MIRAQSSLRPARHRPLPTGCTHGSVPRIRRRHRRRSHPRISQPSCLPAHSDVSLSQPTTIRLDTLNVDAMRAGIGTEIAPRSSIPHRPIRLLTLSLAGSIRTSGEEISSSNISHADRAKPHSAQLPSSFGRARYDRRLRFQLVWNVGATYPAQTPL